jgi:ribose/xylose/arabinose/galactoside ABC-type transport system permease subunit
MALPQEAMTAAKGKERRGARASLVRFLLSEYVVLGLSLVYAAVMIPFVPELASPEVIANILSDMMPLLIVALGQTIVLIIGGIDLSVTATISFASVVGASVMTLSDGYVTGPLGMPAGLLAMLGVGLLIGLINGLSVTRLNMPPFVVTLATTTFFSGSAIWYTTFHSTTTSIYDLPEAFTAIGDQSVLSVPIAALVALAAVFLAHVILARTVLGRWFYAIGKNQRTAVVSGVPVRRTVLAAFVLSGLFAALSSVVYTARLQTGTPILGDKILLDIIGAVVIGGTSLFGGKGKVLWTIFGVLFLVLVDTTLKLLGASLFAIYVIKGSVILAAALLDRLRTRYLAGR